MFAVSKAATYVARTFQKVKRFFCEVMFSRKSKTASMLCGDTSVDWRVYVCLVGRQAVGMRGRMHGKTDPTRQPLAWVVWLRQGMEWFVCFWVGFTTLGKDGNRLFCSEVLV